jgi:MFS transporter, DHA1 family, multidrug resistance protein
MAGEQQSMGALVVIPAPTDAASDVKSKAVRPLLILAGLAGLSPLALDMYLPALPAITSALQTNPGNVQRTLMVFFIGQCIGMLLAGPLSDRIGRRPLILTGVFLFALTSFASAFTQTIDALMMLRFLQAIGCGAAVVLARSVVRDVYPAKDAPRVLSLMALIAGVAPLLSPLLGAALLALAGWRAIFALLSALALVTLIAVWQRLPETYPAAERSTVSVGSAFAAYGRIMLDSRGLGYALISGLTSGALFTYLAASPFVFIDYFGLSPLAFSGLFAVNVSLIMAAAYLNSRLVGRLGAKFLLDVGIVVFVVAATVLALSGTLGIGGLFGVAIPLAFVIGMHQFVLANALARLLALFPGNAGAAAAMQGAMMFALGAAGSGLVSVLHNGTPAPLCLVIGLMGVAVLASRMLLMGQHID